MPLAEPPPCRAVGRQCLGLDVTLRVATFEAGSESADHEATWLLGHTERIRFGPLERRGRHLYVRATLAVPCRYANDVDGTIHCAAHGFRGEVRHPVVQRVSRRLGDGRFEYVERGRLTTGPLEREPVPKRALPLAFGSNPCATARCRTADNSIGAACCRDLQLEIICPPKNRRLELLIRARKSPYLCKVERDAPDSLGVEVISACSFLEADGVQCSLHGRRRRDGRSAKPDLCYTWPSKGDVFHTGCVFKPLDSSP